jgi:DNA-binding NtrC family response regulator
MNKSILLTEDNDDLRQISTEILELGGFEVRTAGNGKEALDLLRSGFRPGCFLLDLGLPDMSCEQFFTEYEKLEDFSSIPLVIASGRADLEKWFARSGALRMIRKPYDFDSLINIAQELCIGSVVAVNLGEVQPHG